MKGSNLTGSFRIRITRPALDEVRKLSARVRDGIEIRRHLLKLRFWPENHPEDERGQILDLDWCWLKSLPKLKVGELRIHDVISGHDNLRAIFYVGDSRIREPLPMIWILSVFQKKTQEISTHKARIFEVRKIMVQERFESGHSGS